MVNSSWFPLLQAATRQATAEAIAAIPKARMFGSAFRCVDPRCGERGYGEWLKDRRTLGGGVSGGENADAVLSLLGKDVAHARRLGKRLLAIGETHADCKFGELHDLNEKDIWDSFKRSCNGLPNTVLVWVSRTVTTGAIAIHGPRDPRQTVATATLKRVPASSCTDYFLRHLLRQIGFTGEDLLNDLVHCLRGNLERPRRLPQPAVGDVGIVVGSGIPGGPTHFSISDRVGQLREALELAAKLLQTKQGGVPYVAVVIPRHPLRIQTKSQVYDAALRNLKLRVTAELNRLRLRCPVVPLFATKCTGDLHLVKI